MLELKISKTDDGYTLEGLSLQDIEDMVDSGIIPGLQEAYDNFKPLSPPLPQELGSVIKTISGYRYLRTPAGWVAKSGSVFQDANFSHLDWIELD